VSLAIEKMTAGDALAQMPWANERTGVLLDRLSPQLELGQGSRILDVGAAQGLYVASLRERGFDALGVDPWAGAIEAAEQISSSTALEAKVVFGDAENLPVGDASQRLVIALSVLEHVDDPLVAMREACRVLEPGGGFYFYSTSALCPRQDEIRRFPLFGWYPGPLKRRIMSWAAAQRPSLVNHTTRPAYHWFTPRKVGALASEAGFSRVVDRWSLRAAVGGTGTSASVARLAASNGATRFAADVLVQDSAYLLVK
jgi:ubiquinone/menaquinone biosynthesis C-methylase UbiE